VKEELIRYKPGRDPRPEGRTDWERLKRMTDEEIEAAALADPDAQPMTDQQLARVYRPGAIVAVRERLGTSQAEFARRFWINLRSLQDWEQGRRVPEDIARAYLRVIERNPEVVAAALRD
jgi:putative transcriptional regulator